MQSDSLQLIEVYTTFSGSQNKLSPFVKSHSIRRLDELLKSPFSESYSLLVVGGNEISPLHLHQWLQKNREHFHRRLKVIYGYEFLSKSEIILLSETDVVFKVLNLDQPADVWKEAWQEAVQSFSSQSSTENIMGKLRTQNKLLNEFNENLEKIVEQRTHHLEVSKK